MIVENFQGNVKFQVRVGSRICKVLQHVCLYFFLKVSCPKTEKKLFKLVRFKMCEQIQEQGNLLNGGGDKNLSLPNLSRAGLSLHFCFSVQQLATS